MSEPKVSLASVTKNEHRPLYVGAVLVLNDGTTSPNQLLVRQAGDLAAEAPNCSMSKHTLKNLKWWPCTACIWLLHSTPTIPMLPSPYVISAGGVGC